MVDKGVGLGFTLRKHWKKSLFAGCLLSYGFHNGSNKFRDSLIRRQYFLEAKTFGEETCSPIEKPRRLYVILNPQAGNSNAKKLFQKNAAPIFYLAGIDITYIQTDYEGHSKTIINYFDPMIDGIVVAGGDGTLHEVLTGILRQPKEDIVLNKPIGFIPLGNQSNFVYRKLFGHSTNQIRSICDATMSIVKGNTKKIAVMDIKTADKSVFALSSIHAGSNNNIKQQIHEGRFWLLGPMKRYFTVLWNVIRDWPPSDVVYVSSAFVKFLTNNSIQMPNRIPSFPLVQVACKEKDIITSDENHLRQGSSDTTINSNKEGLSEAAYSVSSKSFTMYLQETDNMEPCLLFQNLKINNSRQDFVKYCIEWMRNDFEYVPTELSDTMTCSEINITPGEHNQNLTYGIDGEVFDARPITVTICPTRINVFCR